MHEPSSQERGMRAGDTQTRHKKFGKRGPQSCWERLLISRGPWCMDLLSAISGLGLSRGIAGVGGDRGGECSLMGEGFDADCVLVFTPSCSGSVCLLD